MVGYLPVLLSLLLDKDVRREADGSRPNRGHGAGEEVLLARHTRCVGSVHRNLRVLDANVGRIGEDVTPACHDLASARDERGTRMGTRHKVAVVVPDLLHFAKVAPAESAVEAGVALEETQGAVHPHLTEPVPQHSRLLVVLSGQSSGELGLQKIYIARLVARHAILFGIKGFPHLQEDNPTEPHSGPDDVVLDTSQGPPSDRTRKRRPGGR
mmetsp:Transcript_13384/g.31029  ORF Transcript_13384/g.31029 Transcript_13384/m.31029 type:complete len:212 (+) Transcript_13384:482-1117(+)